MSKLIAAARAVTPPIVWSGLSRLNSRLKRPAEQQIYSRYDDALSACGGLGYSDSELAETIFAKARSLPALAETRWPAEWLAGASIGLLLASRLNEGRPTRVLDFGGQLGFHQDVLAAAYPGLATTWAVVDTDAMVSRTSQTASRAWFNNHVAAIDWLGAPDIVLCSGVLQYVENPQRTVAEIVAIGAPILVWQRMALTDGDQFTIVQASRLRDNGPGKPDATMPDREVRYPSTFFPETQFLAAHKPSYELVTHLVQDEGQSISGRRVSIGSSFIFRRR